MQAKLRTPILLSDQKKLPFNVFWDFRKLRQRWLQKRQNATKGLKTRRIKQIEIVTSKVAICVHKYNNLRRN